MDYKTCNFCKETKPLEDFSKYAKGYLGKRSKCRACVSDYNKSYARERYANDESFRERKKLQALEWVIKNPEKRAQVAKRRNARDVKLHPEKIKARALVNQRVRFKRIPKASELKCICCGEQAKHYHHHNGYSFENRYDVVPVCIKCHLTLD
jgi:hypothetical protein